MCVYIYIYIYIHKHISYHYINVHIYIYMYMYIHISVYTARSCPLAAWNGLCGLVLSCRLPREIVEALNLLSIYMLCE